MEISQEKWRYQRPESSLDHVQKSKGIKKSRIKNSVLMPSSIWNFAF
jgi:hypothetical protein